MVTFVGHSFFNSTHSFVLLILANYWKMTVLAEKPDWLILCSQRWTSFIQSEKTRPGADCGSDHELTAKFRPKLKKVEKTTCPFKYDLNQIPYGYTVKMMNRFRGLNLVDRVLEELWTEVHNIVPEAVTKTFPKKKKCKKANDCLKRPYK